MYCHGRIFGANRLGFVADQIDLRIGKYVIKVRNEVVDASIKASLGFVSSVENDTPHAEPYYDYQADLVSMKEYPDRYDLIVTITTNASFTEGVGYTVNGRRVAVGAKLYMMFPEFLGEGYCVSLREIG